MIATLTAVWRLMRALGRALSDPTTRGIVLLAVLVLIGGTTFYSLYEGWSVIDALYFSVVTLTTIGFGDLTPTSDGAKLFTVAYSLTGIGIIASLVASLALFVRSDAEKQSEFLIRHLPRHRRSKGQRERAVAHEEPVDGNAPEGPLEP